MRRPSLLDVAQRAGVSPALASYVLSGRRGRTAPAAPKTVELVRQAAAELGYSPNQNARNLRRQRTEQVLVLVERLDTPWNDRLVERLQQEADRHRYSVLAVLVDSDQRLQHVLELLRRGVADAVVVTAMPHTYEADELEGLEARGTRVLVFSDSLPPGDFDVVRVHEYEACRSALDTLFERGRRRVAFIGHPHDADQGSPSPRYRAYLDATTSSGGHLETDLVVGGAEDRVAAYRSTERLLAGRDRPDAIFSASDRGAISALIALEHAGVRVPEEVAVVGFGSVPEGEIARPPLTTIGRNGEGFEDVARQLFRRLEKGDVGPREIDFPARVIWRQSAGEALAKEESNGR